MIPGTAASPRRWWHVTGLSVPKPQERTAADYRAEAEQVRRQAQAATNQTVQRQLLAIAAGYDDLAKTVEIITRQRRDL